jgi:crossover junction endodeoxyribonuclease RuvC
VIFFGIDPGTAITGYGVIETEGSARYHIAHGVVRTPQGIPAASRLRLLYDTLKGLLSRYQPDCVAIEELFFSTNTKTAIAVAEARGVALLCAAEVCREVMEFTPNRVKQAVTQNGRAEKHEVQTMVKLLLSLAEIPRPDDAADALAVALCASQEPRWLPAARKMIHR